MAKFRVTFSVGSENGDLKIIDAQEFKIASAWIIFADPRGEVVATIAASQVTMIERIAE